MSDQLSDLVEMLQPRRRREVELPTGLKVGYHLPDMEEMIVKIGQLPTGALAELNRGTEVSEAEAIEMVGNAPDAVATGFRFTQLVVATMLDDIDGKPMPDDQEERLQIVRLLEPDDRQKLFRIGNRTEDPDSGKA